MPTEAALLLVWNSACDRNNAFFWIWFKPIYEKFIIFALSTVVSIHLTCNNFEYSCQKLESYFLHTGYCMLQLSKQCPVFSQFQFLQSKRPNLGWKNKNDNTRRLKKLLGKYFTFSRQRKTTWKTWSYIFWSIRWCHARVYIL